METCATDFESVACGELRSPGVGLLDWFASPHGFPIVLEDACGFADCAELIVTHRVVPFQLPVGFEGKRLEASNILGEADSNGVVDHLAELFKQAE